MATFLSTTTSSFLSVASRQAGLFEETLQGVPFEVKCLGHSLFVCALLKGRYNKRNSWLQGFIITFLGGFGGGMISNLLLHEPPSVFTINFIVVGHFIAYWLINYCPYGLGEKFHSLLPIKVACKAFSNYLKAATIVDRVQLAAIKFPGAVTAPLVLGAIGGCGGKITIDSIDAATGGKTVHELAEPTEASRGSLLMAFLYYLMVYVFFVRGSDAAALIMTFMVVHGITEDLLGTTLDWTFPMYWLFHTVTMIPYAKAEEPAKVVRSARPVSVSAAEAKPTSVSAAEAKPQRSRGRAQTKTAPSTAPLRPPSTRIRKKKEY